MKKIFYLFIAASLSLPLYPLSENQKKGILYSAAGIATLSLGYGAYYIIKGWKKVEKIEESTREVIKLSNGITIFQSLAPVISNREWKYTWDDVPKNMPSVPFITAAEFGRITILHNNATKHLPSLNETRADFKIYSQQKFTYIAYDTWQWNADTKGGKETSHANGIQAHEITDNWLRPEEEIKLEVLILTMGVENAVRTDSRQETLSSYFKSEDCKKKFPNLKEVHILPTPEAVELYNTLAAQEIPTLLYAHMTC